MWGCSKSTQTNWPSPGRLSTESARRASHWLAVVLGHCRLEGVDLGSLDGSLPAPVALAACRRQIHFLARCTRDVAQLEQRLDEAGGVVEANDLCFGLLEARMQAWAAFVAIDEAYQVCLEDRYADRTTFAGLLDLVLDNTEELDLRMNVEIHAPCPIDGPLVHKWVEIIEKHKTTHFGLNPDMGLFVMKAARIERDRKIRDGQMRQNVAEFVDKGFAAKMPQETLAVELNNMMPLPGETGYLRQVYSPGGQDVRKLLPLLPYSHHIHAKFYEMTEDYQEYSIPYDQIVAVLKEGGYEGYLVSEWEGQRITQDAFETDSCEQVRRQHLMLKRLLGEA